MDELISRKALLAEYDRVHVGPPGGTRKLIEEAPAVQQWIPVTERLPERDARVLCIGQRGGMFLGECPSLFSDGTAYFYVPNARRCRFATHWMPLPEPPKGE